MIRSMSHAARSPRAIPSPLGRAAALVAAILAMQGCVHVSAKRAPAGAQAASPVASPWIPPRDLRWFRASAERRAAYAQAYRMAWERVEVARDHATGPWAVILDADETILDNSEYQERLSRTGARWEQSTWDAWTLERRAPAFPEAREFVERVRAAGGHVAVVTNRLEPTCAATRANLQAERIPFDSLQCAPGASQLDKQPRFDSVAAGALEPASPPRPMAVLLYVGDSITDCPRQTQQDVDTGLFGTRCIVLPNPMYGGWERNEYR